LEYTGIVILDRARDAGFESNFPAHLFASRPKREIVSLSSISMASHATTASRH